MGKTRSAGGAATGTGEPVKECSDNRGRGITAVNIYPLVTLILI